MPIDLKQKTPGGFRILLVDLSRRFGGASVRALTLAAHMSPGYAAIAGLEDSPVMNIARERNIPTRIVGRSRADPFIPFRLRNIIRKESFQIIDTQNIQSKFWGSLAALITDVAFVSTLNSAYENEFGQSLKGKVYSRIDQLTNFKADQFIAVSAAIRASLLEKGISESMVNLVTNAVETNESSLPHDREMVRRELEIPDNACVCVGVGRLVWAKGFDDFVNAFRIVHKQVPNAYALILGGGDLYLPLSEQIKAAGLERKMFLLGHCDPTKVMNVVKASDVFVLSSRSEGVPYALLEAASLGLPIVSTNCGGIPDVLTNNVDALLVPVGDTQAMAAGIASLFLDQRQAHKLGAQARLKIERDYSVQKLVEATQTVYQRAITGKKG